MRRRGALRRLSTWRAAACAWLTGTALTGTAHATGFAEHGADIVVRDKVTFELDGYLRMRAEALHNFDLDRGLTPSGQPLYPVPLGDPEGQTLTHADMRARTDLKVYAPGSTLAFKLRLDFLDNVTLGSRPNGVPSATTSQLQPAEPIRVRRAYGEALLPFGVLVAGRTGNTWGLGIVANGGDCYDCDSADSSDRIALISPILNHYVAAAFDFSSTGPTQPRPNQNRVIGIAPITATRTFTLAILKYKSDEVRERRTKAGRSTLEYGGYFTHRWQNKDIPASYIESNNPVVIGPSQVMDRSFTATAFDLWSRFTFPYGRIEAEAAILLANYDQGSLIPGLLLRDPVKSRQIGAALESHFGPKNDRYGGGLDLGYASGDSAPGFGVNQNPTGRTPRAGDLDGLQNAGRYDTRIDNFRFHPDYRIDRILFREIIGSVTDAVYLRPHGKVDLINRESYRLQLTTAVIGSMAVYAQSTPGGKRPLGIEIDPSLVYTQRGGFQAALDYGVLFPLAGLDNTIVGMVAKPAQMVRLRLVYAF